MIPSFLLKEEEYQTKMATKKGSDKMDERMRQIRKRWLFSLPILISVGVVSWVGINKAEAEKGAEESVLTLIESDLGLKKPLQVEPPFSESEPNQENNHWKVEVEEHEAVDKDASSPPTNEDPNPPLKEEGEPSNPSQMETLPDSKPPVEDDSVDEDLPQPPVMEEGSEDESENENENENENDIEEDQEETIQEIVPPQIEIEEIGKQLKVTITHELLTGSEEEELQYRIDYQEWEIYEAPFYLPIDDYVIESQLVMGETVSASAKEDVLPKLPTLEAPRIEVTAEKYRAEVSLSHPRFEGLSEEAIEYRIENQEWQPYEKPFDWLPEWQSLEVRYREGSRVSEVKREIIAFEHPICERGNATKESPCVITTPEQLNALQLYVNEEQLETAGRYYELGNDLDFEGYDNDDNPDNGNWTPIGTLDLGFEGIFDGKGHSILNVEINLPNRQRSGFFGRIAYAEVKNLVIDAIRVNGNNFTGGLAGVAAWDSLIENVAVTGQIKGQNDVGGIVGYLHGSTLEEPYSKVSVEGGNYVGGIVGQSLENSIISYGYSVSGDVIANDYAGGAVGMNKSGSMIYQIYSTNTVQSNLNKGGLVAGAFGIEVDSGYWDTSVSRETQGASGIGLTTSQMTGFNALKYMEGFDFEDTWQLCQGDYPQLKTFATCTPLQTGYAGGSGTKEDPYLISNEQQLDWLRFEVNELGMNTSGVYYELTNTLDFSTYDSDGIDENGNWTPIGGKKIFQGNFDGNGYTILNMVILDKESSFLGLFGHVSGHIFELGVVDYYIEGNTYLGGIAGRNYEGLISRSYSKGEIKGEARIGGIVGHNISNATIMDCYAMVNLEGVDKIGGVVGYSYQDGNIVSSYATGSMDGKTMVGAILGGGASSMVLNSYWDNEAMTSVNSNYGTGLTTSQMTGVNAINYMEGFDFENTWQACEGDYPQLKVFATCQPVSKTAENQEELTSVEEEKPLMEEEMADAINESSDPEEETNPEIEAVLVETTSESEVVEEKEVVMIESEKTDVIEEDILPIEENEDYFLKEAQEMDELSEEINLKEGEEGAYIIESEKTTEKAVVFSDEAG